MRGQSSKCVKVLTDGEDAKLRLLGDSASESPRSDTDRVFSDRVMSAFRSGRRFGASHSAEGKATEARCLIWAALGFIQYPACMQDPVLLVFIALLIAANNRCTVLRHMICCVTVDVST